MKEITLVNNEFLRQFEVHVEDSLARIEYSEQERKIIKVLEFIEDKRLSVVPTSPKIAGFVRRNRRYKQLLPVGIKL